MLLFSFTLVLATQAGRSPGNGYCTCYRNRKVRLDQGSARFAKQAARLAQNRPPRRSCRARPGSSSAPSTTPAAPTPSSSWPPNAHRAGRAPVLARGAALPRAPLQGHGPQPGRFPGPSARRKAARSHRRPALFGKAGARRGPTASGETPAARCGRRCSWRPRRRPKPGLRRRAKEWPR